MVIFAISDTIYQRFVTKMCMIVANQINAETLTLKLKVTVKDEKTGSCAIELALLDSILVLFSEF